MPICMLIYLTLTECVLPSHHSPGTLALNRRRGERSGRGQPRPFRLCGTVSSFGQGKQTGLAPRQGGLSRVALPGQGIAWDRTEWDGKALIDAVHYFHPRKLGQLQTERCHGNWGKGSQAEAFHPSLPKHICQLDHKRTDTDIHKYAHFLTLTEQQILWVPQTFVSTVAECYQHLFYLYIWVSLGSHNENVIDSDKKMINKYTVSFTITNHTIMNKNNLHMQLFVKLCLSC